jgi:hypothetical protein
VKALKLLFILFMVLLLGSCASGDVKKTSSVPDTAAYDFTLPDQNGKLFKLSDVLKHYRGAVLAFYPKDDTKN